MAPPALPRDCHDQVERDNEPPLRAHVVEGRGDDRTHRCLLQCSHEEYHRHRHLRQHDGQHDNDGQRRVLQLLRHSGWTTDREHLITDQ